jgi:surfeit locus 1 family protein
MTRRMILPLIFGIAGMAILLALGIWQVQRLAWKQAVLATISTRLEAAPVALPVSPDPAADLYLAVTVSGRFTGAMIDVLTSRKEIGAGYRVVEAFETGDGRRIMVDRGFLPIEDRDRARVAGAATVVGTLNWPDETDRFTPPPDPASGMWFARDVPAMAEALGAEPVLVVARSQTGDGIEPMPVDTSGIPNDHLSYAITWFSLAAVWMGMTVLLLWRIRRRTD